VVAFCTEHGFVGGLNDRILRAAPPGSGELLVVGTRGQATAGEARLGFRFIGPMATDTAGLGEVADRITDALYPRFAAGELEGLEIVFGRRSDAGAITIERRALLPLEPANADERPPSAPAPPPVTYLPHAELLARLVEEYLYALLIDVAAQSFAAENTARLAVLQSAHTHLDDLVEDLRAADRRLRQEEITSEVVELALGRGRHHADTMGFRADRRERRTDAPER
jgi:F-type H+-transporting ATPase subunit gamma